MDTHQLFLLHLHFNLIIFFIPILFNPTSYSEEYDPRFLSCSQPFKCGTEPNITIGYPFWGGERQDFCGGHEGYQLKCHNNDYATIEMNELEFRVLHINQPNQTMRIARNDLWEDLCIEKYINTGLNAELFNYATTNTNGSLYNGCPYFVPKEKINNFTCPGNGTSSVGFYVGESFAENEKPDFWLCNRSVELPVYKPALDEFWDKNLTLQQALSEGFEVTYNVKHQNACLKCTESIGTCGSNVTMDSFQCFCGDGPTPSTCSSSDSDMLDGDSAKFCFSASLYNERISARRLPVPCLVGLKLGHRRCAGPELDPMKEAGQKSRFDSGPA
ncbi:Wall-associated receptor kinase, galacturonan-binding domain [Dillenia turbinata]|uniref:non-specific serine/threonine protein kinase n=1 Tax=Dillenia turbinata TaxID=194707 RepID=A0AAN8Z308_9MAGN